MDPFFLNYQSYDQILNKLFQWQQQFPKLLTILPSLGKTHENRDIIAIKISNLNFNNNKKSIWFNGGLHAREWISPATVLFQIYSILNNYNIDFNLQFLLNKFDLYFTPLSNPDGYEYSRIKDRLWRKNRRKNNNNSYGVDLNRNFIERFGSIGSSKIPTSETYHGLFPLSEPETRALAKFGQSIPNKYAAIDWHSYGQTILRPWGFKVNTPSSNEIYLKTLSEGMSKIFLKNQFKFSSDLSAGLYPAGGAMDDYMNAQLGLQAFTIELCPTDDQIGFLLPKEAIIPCANAAYQASIYFMSFFAKYYNLLPNKPILD